MYLDAIIFSSLVDKSLKIYGYIYLSIYTFLIIRIFPKDFYILLRHLYIS